MAKKGQVFKKLDKQTRLKAVLEKIVKGKSYVFLGERYGVSWKTVETWVRIYKRDGGLDIKKKGRPSSDEIDYKERYEILKKYLEYLEEVDRGRK